MNWTIEHGMMVRHTPSPGPRVVWLHGLGESSVSFEPVLDQLPGFDHVLVDLPGYGRSSWPDAAGSLERVADDLSRWLGDAPPAALVGHSMGGVLASFVAERTEVRAVVNVDGNLSPGDCVFSGAAAALSEADFVASGFAELRAQVYADGAARPELRGYHAAMCFASPRVFHRHACDLVELSAGGSLAPRLAALDVPALFVAGVPDGVCARSLALLDTHRVRWIGIEPAGHWVYLDQLERFAHHVGAFLREC